MLRNNPMAMMAALALAGAGTMMPMHPGRASLSASYAKMKPKAKRKFKGSKAAKKASRKT